MSKQKFWTDWKKYSIKYLAVVPFLVRIIQEVQRATFHGVDRLTQQPVFVLESAKNKDMKKKKFRYQMLQDLLTAWTNLSRFVEAAIPRGFDIGKGFLVVRSCRPGGVWSRRRQHHEEGVLRAPVVQEVQGPVRLHQGRDKNWALHRFYIRFETKINDCWIKVRAARTEQRGLNGWFIHDSSPQVM